MISIAILIILEMMKREKFIIKCNDQLILSSSLFFIGLLLPWLITRDECISSSLPLCFVFSAEKDPPGIRDIFILSSRFNPVRN